MMTCPGNPVANGYTPQAYRPLTAEEASEQADQLTNELQRIARERAWVRQFGGSVRYT